VLLHLLQRLLALLEELLVLAYAFSPCSFAAFPVGEELLHLLEVALERVVLLPGLVEGLLRLLGSFCASCAALPIPSRFVGQLLERVLRRARVFGKSDLTFSTMA